MYWRVLTSGVLALQDARDDVGGAMQAGMQGILVQTGAVRLLTVHRGDKRALAPYTPKRS